MERTPNDILYNIMLHSDIETLEDLCFSDKNTLQICNTTNFWINKFRHDNLPKLINGTNALQWITEYKKVVQILERTNILFNLIDNEIYNFLDDSILLVIDFTFIDDCISLLPVNLISKIPELDLEEDYYQTIYLQIYKSDDEIVYSITYSLYDEHGNELFDDGIYSSKQEAISMIFKILYYYPDKDITDANNLSYFKERLLEDLDAIGIGNFSKSARDKLLARLQFWK